MKNVYAAVVLLAALTSACAPDPIRDTSAPAAPTFRVDSPPTALDPYRVRARATLEVSTDSESASLFDLLPAAYAASGNKPITVELGAALTFGMSDTRFSVPAVSNSLLDFGYLDLTALDDNSLKVCGLSGNTKCTQAVIRVYTTGKPGAGMWNPDGYGQPLLANGLTTGLNVAGAVTVATYTIPNSKHRLTLSDFSVTAYNIASDFTDAGAGSYSTTVVLEYALQ